VKNGVPMMVPLSGPSLSSDVSGGAGSGVSSLVQGAERFWLSICQLPGRMAVTAFGRKDKMVFAFFASFLSVYGVRQNDFM
jgi:hypothetical protein